LPRSLTEGSQAQNSLTDPRTVISLQNSTEPY